MAKLFVIIFVAAVSASPTTNTTSTSTTSTSTSTTSTTSTSTTSATSTTGSDPARVVFTPTMQYLPLNLSGIIHCHIESNPTFQFITWTKDKRLFDPFDTVGIQSLTNGSLKISKVTKDHAGDYTCTPYNVHGTAGTSGIMQVHVRDPPVINVFPEDQYVMSVGDKVTMPCMAGGVPTPNIQWRRVEGHHLPKKRHKLYQGTLTIEGLQKKDHGIYECVVSNDVATLTARTKLIIEKTSPHAPHNVTVTSKETFAVTIKWLPGYAGCSDCKQTYKIRYREQNSRMPNWIELPVNPPDARQIQIHNLLSGTTHEFQVIGTNQYGDGMFSQIVEARTKESVAVSASISKLRKDLFKDYDNQIIPVKSHKKPVEMAFGLALIDIDTQNDGTVNLETWLRVVWNDHRLQWHESDYNGISVLRLPAENVWLPDIKLYNQLGLAEKGEPLKDSATNVLVYPDGEMLYVPPATFKIHCFNESSFGVQKNWPWQEHKCHMKFGSWTYDGFQLDLSLYNNKAYVDMSDFRAGPVRIVDNKLVKNKKFYPCCPEPYPSINATFTLQQLYRVDPGGAVTYNPFIEIGDLQHGNYSKWS